jgi:hypothetical protein
VFDEANASTEAMKDRHQVWKGTQKRRETILCFMVGSGVWTHNKDENANKNMHAEFTQPIVAKCGSHPLDSMLMARTRRSVSPRG